MVLNRPITMVVGGVNPTCNNISREVKVRLPQMLHCRVSEGFAVTA